MQEWVHKTLSIPAYQPCSLTWVTLHSRCAVGVTSRPLAPPQHSSEVCVCSYPAIASKFPPVPGNAPSFGNPFDFEHVRHTSQRATSPSPRGATFAVVLRSAKVRRPFSILCLRDCDAYRAIFSVGYIRPRAIPTKLISGLLG